MRRSTRPPRGAIVVLLPFLAACRLGWTEVEEEALVIASVTVVLTVDPMDSTVQSTDVLALLVRDSVDDRVPGASVRITSLSDRTLTLEELPDTSEACRGPSAAPTVGTCYAATVPSAYFTALDDLLLRVVLPDGKHLFGDSKIPGLFTPYELSLEDGRCRVSPETNYRIRWRAVAAASAHIAEAEFAGLRSNIWDDPGPLYLAAAWMASYSRYQMGLPRTLIEDDVPWNARKAARRLESGLPWGVTVTLAVAAVDRNWANWIRPGRVHTAGEVPVPSVFGDGTGMFGTAVRWTATIESRDAEDQTGLVDCDLGRVSYD